MSCLGEPSRFRLVRRLLRGECCVSDLAVEVGLSQSCTTRHLQALERERLVEGERRGKRVLFRLRTDDPQVVALLAWALSGRTGKAPASASAAHPGGAEIHLDRARPLRPSAPKRSPGFAPSRTRVRGRGAARPALKVASVPSPGTERRPSRPSAAPTQSIPAPAVQVARSSPPPPAAAPSQAQTQVHRPRTQELEDYLL